MSTLLCACGQPARYYVFQASQAATAACVRCADSAPFYVVVRPIEVRASGSVRVVVPVVGSAR
jgi:hypothetical protein